MATSVAAGGPPERAYLRAILWDLQACLTQPARIIHYCTRDMFRRLLFNRGTGSETAGTGDETLNASFKGTGTAEKVSPAADCDENYYQRQDFDYSQIDYYAVCESMDEGDEDSSNGEDDDISDDGIDRQWPPPGLRISYTGDSSTLRSAYMFSRNLVELLAVRPRFHFVGSFVAYGAEMLSLYHCSSQRGKTCRNVDSQGNLILHAEGTALRDRFNIEIKIPEDGNEIDDAGCLSFVVDPYACNRVITRTISTRHSRKIDVTFMAMYAAIQANVEVALDLMSGSGNIYVYGEITARHQLYGDERVMLFSREEKDKVEVVNGILPLSRKWAAVPIYLEPLLIVKLNLRVLTNHDGEGPIISFRGDMTFYRDQFEKILSSADHSEVKVRISYR